MKQNKYQSLEEKYFISDILEMAKRSGKKFALDYLDDIEKRPNMGTDEKSTVRGRHIRQIARKQLLKNHEHNNKN